jgi:hypothetical protein
MIKMPSLKTWVLWPIGIIKSGRKHKRFWKGSNLIKAEHIWWEQISRINLNCSQILTKNNLACYFSLDLSLEARQRVGHCVCSTQPSHKYPDKKTCRYKQPSFICCHGSDEGKKSFIRLAAGVNCEDKSIVRRGFSYIYIKKISSNWPIF